jgi:serine phosphatase RsbU (regulator of sigma subunit)
VRSIRQGLLTLGQRLTPHPVPVAIAAVALEFLFLGTLGRGSLGFPAGDMLITGAVTALIAWGAAAIGGARAGLATALGAGAAYLVFVSGVSSLGAVESTLAATAILAVAAYVTGVVASALRRQAGERERLLGARLDRALWERGLLERALGSLPRLRERGSEEEVAREVCARLAGEFGCDGALVFARRDHGHALLAAAPALQPAGRAPRYGPQDLRRLALALRDRSPVFVPDLAAQRLSPSARDLARALRATAALLAVPQGRSDLFCLMYWRDPVTAPDAEVMMLAQRFVDQAGMAMGHVRQMQARAEADQLQLALQQGLLPPLAIDHPAIWVATVYRAGERRLLLGGDFVDVLALPDGGLAAIIGDVSGKGPRAAAVGATLRASWRALTLAGTDLATMMETLGETFVAERHSAGEFVTACLAKVDPDGRQLRLVSAGHPPPLLFATGSIREVEVRPFLPLGVTRRQRWRPAALDLPPAWRLLFYTDGLVEGLARPEERERLGMGGLLELLDGTPAFLHQGALQALVAQVTERNGGPLADDVALIGLSSRSPDG